MQYRLSKRILAVLVTLFLGVVAPAWANDLAGSPDVRQWADEAPLRSDVDAAWLSLSPPTNPDGERGAEIDLDG